MKLVLNILILFLCFQGFSQDWEEELNQARKLYKAGKYKEALKYYKSAEKLAPKDVDLSEEKGQTAYRAGDFKTASECYERQANNSKNANNQLRAKTNLGESRMKQQDYQGAVDVYKDILRKDASNEKARQRLMEAQRLLKQQQKSQQDKQNQQQDQKQQEKQNQSNQNQQNQQKDSQQQKSGQQKLQDKETERKLDELSKQELGTKKRLDGSKGISSGNKAKKDW